MHKKWTDRFQLTKKTSHCNGRAFSSKTPTKNTKTFKRRSLLFVENVSRKSMFSLFSCVNNFQKSTIRHFQKIKNPIISMILYFYRVFHRSSLPFFLQSLSHHLSTLLIREPNVIPALTTEHTIHVVKSEIMQDWRDFLSFVFCTFVQEIFLKISCRFSVDFDYGYTNQVVALLFQIDVSSRISNNVDVYELITVDTCQHCAMPTESKVYILLFCQDT